MIGLFGQAYGPWLELRCLNTLGFENLCSKFDSRSLLLYCMGSFQVSIQNHSWRDEHPQIVIRRCEKPFLFGVKNPQKSLVNHQDFRSFFQSSHVESTQSGHLEVSIIMGYPHSWMVHFMENPALESG